MKSIILKEIYDSFCSQHSTDIEHWLESSCQECAKRLFTSQKIPTQFKSYKGKLYRGIVSDSYTHTKQFTSWTKDKSVALKFLSDKKYATGKTGNGLLLTIDATSLDVLDIQNLVLFCGNKNLDSIAFDSATKEGEVIVGSIPESKITIIKITSVKEETENLNSILKWAKTIGVDLEFGWSAPKNSFVIANIERDLKDGSTKGNGAIVMKRLTDYADRNGFKIHLDPDAPSGSAEDQDKLVKYYQRFGFKINPKAMGKLLSSDPDLIPTTGNGGGFIMTRTPIKKKEQTK